MKHRTTLYWIMTGLFCLLLGISGVAHASGVGFIAEAMAGLGYPAYLSTIIGVAKLFGVVALLAPGRALLKEWAYAGFTFNLIGAVASHAFVGDPMSEIARPLAALMVGAASYLLRPADRRPASAPAFGESGLHAQPAGVAES